MKDHSHHLSVSGDLHSSEAAKRRQIPQQRTDLRQGGPTGTPLPPRGAPSDPAGRLLWASPALPGSIHDVKAARRHGLVHALTGYDIPVLADRGYQGARGTVRVPFRGRNLPAGPTAVNTSHARLRAPGERGPATLKTWRLLHRLRCCPQRGTNLIAAILALETASRS